MDMGWPPNLSKLSLARLGIPISKTFDFQSDHSLDCLFAQIRSILEFSGRPPIRKAYFASLARQAPNLKSMVVGKDCVKFDMLFPRKSFFLKISRFFRQINLARYFIPSDLTFFKVERICNFFVILWRTRKW